MADASDKCSHREAASAAACFLSVRVVKLEAPTIEVVDEVDFGPVEMQIKSFIDQPISPPCCSTDEILGGIHGVVIEELNW